MNEEDKPPPAGFGVGQGIVEVTKNLDDASSKLGYLSDEFPVYEYSINSKPVAARSEFDKDMFGSLGDRQGGVREKTVRALDELLNAVKHGNTFCSFLHGAVDRSARQTIEADQKFQWNFNQYEHENFAEADRLARSEVEESYALESPMFRENKFRELRESEIERKGERLHHDW